MSPRAVLRLSGLGITIALAYYAGAAVGFALKLPEATPSVMWPPNAILTSALLLTPTRLWPFALLAALPAHVALESGAGFPISLVLALFATNCTEALLAAGGLRFFSDDATRFDSFRRVGLFIAIAVLAAPFLSSFLDAMAVSLLRGEQYWQVWTARLFSNMLTALTVVPAVVTVVTSGWQWLRAAPRTRHGEAALLTMAMLVAAVFVLRRPASDAMTAELAEHAALAWMLPGLLWAAIRFGPGGSSLTLLVSSLVLTSAAVHSHGPFEGLSPSDTTLALQIFLTVVSVPLMVVAALIEERRLAQQDISKRLAVEALLARLSGAFVQLPSNRMHEVFDKSTREIGESLALESVMLFEYADTSEQLRRLAAWSARGDLEPGDPPIPDRFVESVAARLDRKPLAFHLPLTTARSEDAPGGSTLNSVLIPLIAENKIRGMLACTFDASLAQRGSAVLEELELVARVLANALSRRSAEDALRASEATKSAILSSLTYGVVVIDRRGDILNVNTRWHQMIGENAPAAATQVGANYLRFLADAARSGAIRAAKAAEGVAAVLDGTLDDFRQEYLVPHRDGERTMAMRAVPLDHPEGGAVVTYVDLTQQRRAELEAERARAELAHVSRVATLGALTASIAHQLNQPLTGILTNAQAARRFLAGSAPDLEEARLTLDDIMQDDRRASEVIVRMREFLRKDTGPIQNVDLHAVVREVARLVSSAAIIRNTELILNLDEAPAIVHGDRVQLQQVVLNLIVNALEAFGESRPSDRRIVVGSCCSRGDVVEIEVTDNGEGFKGLEESAFEAFYTTKPGGMGLGLSIARSIVEAHAGLIRAANKPDGGATVSFRVPLAPESAG